jgi:ribonuclease P protein component
VRRHSEYRVIQARGRRVHSAHYVWIVMPRTQPTAVAEPRLGITITKKTAQRAVARNRVKRVLREVFRQERALFPRGCDVVVVGKTGAEQLGYADALEELRGVAQKLAAAGRSAPSRPDERRRPA